MRILRSSDFMEGIITEGGRIICNDCKHIFKISEKTFKDCVNLDNDLCEKCYKELIKNDVSRGKDE